MSPLTHRKWAREYLARAQQASCRSRKIDFLRLAVGNSVRAQRLEAAWDGSVTTYRCFFMSAERVQAVQTFECVDDADVVERTTALLDSRPQHQGVEIWQGHRLVRNVSRRSEDLR
jgi:hypothetical protein